ncbi:MAG: cell division protein FtsQ/DivIB [Pseudomonadota bacterium]
MKTFANWFAFLAILAFGAIALISLKNSKQLLVPEILIVSESSRNSVVFDKISKDLSSQFQRFQGLPIWEVSVQEIHSILKKDSRLESFQVRRELPNRIKVALEAKLPLAGLLLEKVGQVLPLSADGSFLAAMSLSEAPDLPLLRGEHLKNDPKSRAKLVEVLSVLPKEGLFSRMEISEIVMNKSGEVSVIMNSDGTKVLLGQSLQAKQVGRIRQVLKYLKSRSIKGRVIDARFSKKVVVRVRKAS